MSRPTSMRCVAGGALLLAIVGLSGCQVIERHLDRTTVTVTAEPGETAPISVGGSTVRARVEAPGGAVTTWEVGGQPVDVEPGEYRLVVWTERQNVLVASCSTPLELRSGEDVDVRYVRRAGDVCELGLE